MPNKDGFFYAIMLVKINQIVNEAVKHGSDAGGSYSQNKEKLKESIKSLLYLFNFPEEYTVISRFDDDYNENPDWAFGKLGLDKSDCWTDIAIAKVNKETDKAVN